MNIREQIAELVYQAVEDAQASELLPRVPIEDVVIDRPQNPDHGDFATSLPLKLARPMRSNPMQIAEKIVSLIPASGPLGKVAAAPPGFINFTLKQDWISEQVETIIREGGNFARIDYGEGRSVQVEFVSGNPTGPLHVGHIRGAVFGSGLASVLETAGFDVTREYYINDAGNQIDQFGRSLYARYLQLFGRDVEVPEDGYVGEYMIELAQEIRDEQGDTFLNMEPDEATVALADIALRKMMDNIRDDLALLGVDFDVWFSERSLFDQGQYERATTLLEDRGYLAEHDGARWFTSSALGEDKDNVLVRSNGIPTYLASDVAYHYNKFVERKFDKVIDVWGADHHGHVSRMRAVIAALGISPDKFTVAITQIVTLKRGGEAVRLSKRSGEIITLRELVEEVGADACRFFFMARSPESQMDFDMELAKQQSADNPVYYVQYAHARIASILRLAEDRGIDHSTGDVHLLEHEAEQALIRKLLVLPDLIEMMARNLEVHHLPHYAQELATAFHWFYQNCRVVSGAEGDEAITRARLKLAEASKIVLARCLTIMGMSTPEAM